MWYRNILTVTDNVMYWPYDHTSDFTETEPSVRTSGADHLIGKQVFAGLRSEVNIDKEKSVTFTTSFSVMRQLRAAWKITQSEQPKIEQPKLNKKNCWPAHLFLYVPINIVPRPHMCLNKGEKLLPWWSLPTIYSSLHNINYQIFMDNLVSF